MSFAWEERKLRDLAQLCLGKMLDQTKNKGVPFPYLANINVRWGYFDLENLREMRFEEREFDRYGLKYGDIVMCEGGEPGRCAIWKHKNSSMMIQKALHRIRPNNDVDSFFLYYALLSKGIRGHYEGLFTGAAIKHLTGESLAKIEVSIPPLPIQNKIARILSAYDDLIENNLKRIKLLEEMAQITYEEWFVRLRFPGHETTAFNPETGLPEGWTKTKLREILKLNYGKALKADVRVAGAFPVYGSSGVVGTHSEALVQGPGIIVGRKGNVGSVFWAHDGFYPIDTVYYVTSLHSLNFLYSALKNAKFDNSDAAVPGLNRDSAYSIETILPPKPLEDRFSELAQNNFKAICLLEKENQRLREARDILLPRLMTGIIDVEQYDPAELLKEVA